MISEIDIRDFPRKDEVYIVVEPSSDSTEPVTSEYSVLKIFEEFQTQFETL